MSGARPSLSDNHIGGLNGLRAIAATSVFAFHAWGQAGKPALVANLGGINLHVDQLLAIGSSGVALFFVLSGFLLSQPFWMAAFGKRSWPDSKAFLVRRFKRIYPAYLVAVLLLALFFDGHHPLWIRAIHTVSHLLMVHNFSEATIYSLSAPLWSVATEFQLYLVLPLVFWGVQRMVEGYKRRGDRMGLPRWRWIRLAFFCAAGILGVSSYYVLSHLVRVLNVPPKIASPFGQVILHSPLVGMVFFATGVVLAGAFVEERLRAPAPPTTRSTRGEAGAYAALVTLPLGALLIADLPLGLNVAKPLAVFPLYWPLMAVVFGLLVYWTAQSRQPWGLAGWLETWPLRSLGEVSYSFYLYHDVMLWLCFNKVAAGQVGTTFTSSVGRSLLAFVATVLAAWLSYQLIEKRYHRPHLAGAPVVAQPTW